jgi:hypothetical protein
MLASKSLVCVRATPNTRSYGSKGSAFSGTVNSFQRLQIRCPSESRVGAVQVEGMLESRGGGSENCGMCGSFSMHCMFWGIN